MAVPLPVVSVPVSDLGLDLAACDVPDGPNVVCADRGDICEHTGTGWFVGDLPGAAVPVPHQRMAVAVVAVLVSHRPNIVAADHVHAGHSPNIWICRWGSHAAAGHLNRAWCVAA